MCRGCGRKAARSSVYFLFVCEVPWPVRLRCGAYVDLRGVGAQDAVVRQLGGGFCGWLW